MKPMLQMSDICHLSDIVLRRSTSQNPPIQRYVTEWTTNE